MAWYRTGTIALTNGSTAITGTGTDFLTGAAVGEGLLAPDGRIYEISSIQSSVGLTLGSGYLGTNASGQSYAIIPSQSYIRDLASQAATLVNSYQSVKDNAGAGKFGDGTVGAPGVSFVADTNTGIRRVGADSFALVTGGADRATVSNSGIDALGLSVAGIPVVTTTSASTLTNKTLTSPTINGGTATLTSLSVNGADQTATDSALTFAIDYAMDQAAQANKRVTDATSYQTQSGTASFTQSSSSEVTRTYATATVGLPKAYRNTDYQVVVEPVSATPMLGFEGEITVQSRSVNSFVLQMSGSATACSVRWKAMHPNAEMRVQAVLPTAQ